MNDLKHKTIIGILWSAVERFGIQGIQFVFGLILARLLSPADFGLVGMLAIFIAIAQSFIDSGFTTALIRKTDATKLDYSTVFWYNLLMSVVFYTIIFFCSKLIADFFEQPELDLLAKIVTLSVIINALGSIQYTILTKKLDFKAQAKTVIWGVLLGGIVGIYFAWKGWGVWALAIQILVRTIINIFLLWVVTKWQPLMLFSKKSFKELFSFGYKLLLSGLLNTFFENIYKIIIGKLFSAQSLGFYTRADQFQKLPVGSIYGVMQKVTFPVLSHIQDDEIRLRNTFRKFIRMTCFIVFPIMTFLGSLAYPMIEIVLTEKWLPSAPLLQIFCLYGALYPLHAINLNILNVKGRSDLFLKLELIKKILVILAILITYRWGVEALLWGQVVLSFFSLFLNTHYSKKLVEYSFYDQFKDLLPTILISIICGIIISTFVYFADNIYIQFLGGSIIGIITFGMIFFLFPLQENKELISIVKFLKNRL